MFTIDEMLGKITGYRDVLKEHGYVHQEGGGRAAWSIRHTNGKSYIDTRNSGWEMLDLQDNVIKSGDTWEQLKVALGES